MKKENLSIGDVVPLLHQIAELIDELLCDEKTEEVSEIIELMHAIVEDNSLYIRN